MFDSLGCKSSSQPDRGESDSEAQGRRCEAGSEGSVEQKREQCTRTDRRRERRASGPMIAKPISIKDAKRKIRWLRVESDRTYLGRSVARLGFGLSVE